MMNMNRYLDAWLFGIVILSSGLAGSLQAEVGFLAGGYADQCAQAADRAEVSQRIPQTGSNLDATAIEICTRAIEGWDGAASGIGESYNNRGVLYFALSDFPRALEDFEAAIRKNPSLGQAHLNRGYVLAALQRWSESIESLSQGLALGQEDQARAYYVRGIANEELGEVGSAYRDYLRASELDPGWDEPREELARFRVRQD